MRLFISYRHTDSGGQVGRIFDRLLHTREFRDGGVFMDVASIGPGAGIAARIEAALSVSDVALVVIGDQWLSVANDAGGRRLDDEDDPVRTEVRLCQKLGVPLLPVLLDGTRMPVKGKLPPAIRDLADRNAVRVSHASFDADFERLLGAVRERAAERQPTAPEAVPEVRPEDFYAVGWYYASQGQFAGARACFEAAVARQARFARAYAGLAWCSQLEANSMIRRRNYGLAEELLEDAEASIRTGLQYDDTDVNLFLQMGYVRKDIAQTFRLIPYELAALQRNLAQWDERAEKAFDGAQTHFKMALGLDPNNASAINGLASLDIIQRNYAQAIKRLEPLVKAHPGYAAARFDLANAYYARLFELVQGSSTPPKGLKKCLEGFSRTCQSIFEMELDPQAEKLPDAALGELKGRINQVSEWVAKMPRGSV